MSFNSLKVLQIRLSIVLILFFSLLGSSIPASADLPEGYDYGQAVPTSVPQENTQIPSWIKNVAGWWATGEISENEFLAGIEYLINNKIILIPFMPCMPTIIHPTVDDVTVPEWIKNNAKWWHEDLITDTDFTNGIEYLIEKQIISIENKKILGNVHLEDMIFSPNWLFGKQTDLVFVASSLFEIYGKDGDCVLSDHGNVGKPIWRSLVLGLSPSMVDVYNDVGVWNDPQKTAVVFPYFTFAAYETPGFYTYYTGNCDACTTTNLTEPYPLYTSSGIGHQALTLLGYTGISDIDIDKDPSILQQYDKIIMLHNEYVTREMFDAITSHPNVIYLYPNALYAEIEVDYVDNTITLIRGHGYPEPEITNGFDWEFDNTHPYEYDSTCENMEFYKIQNGWMTTCYPDIPLKENRTILGEIKNIASNNDS